MQAAPEQTDALEDVHFLKSIEDFVAAVICADGSFSEGEDAILTKDLDENDTAELLCGVGTTFAWPTATEAVTGALARILGLRLQQSDMYHLIVMHFVTASIDRCPPQGASANGQKFKSLFGRWAATAKATCGFASSATFERFASFELDGVWHLMTSVYQKKYNKWCLIENAVLGSATIVHTVSWDPVKKALLYTRFGRKALSSVTIRGPSMLR